MKELIRNNHNLTEDDIHKSAKIVKVIISNSKDEILLAYSYNNYQFPGGHVDEGETLIETLNRETKEETGIELNIDSLEPFACNLGYYKDFPEKGINRKREIYFYQVQTDQEPDLSKTEYTQNEIDGNFELRYIPLSQVEQVIEENAKNYGDKRAISKEIIEIIKIFKENFNKK